MTIGWLRWLAIPLLVLGLALAACGGDEEEEEGQPTPAATVEEEEGAPEEEVEAGAGEAFGGVPVPEGADETASGSWRGSLPFIDPTGEVEAEAYTTIEYKNYEVDASPGEVMDFYRGEMDDWDEVYVFSGEEDGEEVGFGIWMRDDGDVAVWMGFNQADGATDLVIIRGTRE